MELDIIKNEKEEIEAKQVHWETAKRIEIEEKLKKKTQAEEKERIDKLKRAHQKDLQDKDIKINEQEKKINQEMDTIANLENQLKINHKMIESLEKEVEKGKLELQKKTEKCDELELKYKKSIKQLSKENEDLNNKNKDKDKAIANQANKLQENEISYKSQIKQLRDSCDMKLKKLEGLMKEKERQIEEGKTVLKQKDVEISDLKHLKEYYEKKRRDTYDEKCQELEKLREYSSFLVSEVERLERKFKKSI